MNDAFILVERPENSLTVAQLFQLVFAKDKDQVLLERAINSDALPLKKRQILEGFLK